MANLDPLEMDDFENAAIPPQVPTDSVGLNPTAPKSTPLNPIVAQYLQSRMDMGKAQQAANQNQLYAGLARAGGTLAHAISGAKAPMDESGYNALDKSAQAPVQAVKAEQEAALKGAKAQSAMLAAQKEQAKQNADSQESMAFRKIIEKEFPEVAKAYGDYWKDVTASDQENIFKPLQLKEQIRSRLQNAQAMRDQKNTDRIDKMAKSMKDDLDADKGRSGNFGQISGRVQSAERMEGLVQAFKDGNLPAAQMEELALGLANMVSGSTGAARSQVEALVPHSAMGDIQKVKSWILNEPYGANQQKFVDQMMHTVEREKQISLSQLNTIRQARLPAHEGLKKLDPARYNSILHSYGMGESTPSQPNKVKVSNGTETLLIDPSDLASAQKDGYRQVQ